MNDLTEARLGAFVPLRNEPVQARSTARLTALLDAAASAIQDLGYERLTTAMVAERAGASIGTVYRYFPDRIAVLQALAARNLERVLAAIQHALGERKYATWQDAVGGAFDAYVHAFRTEPGFASLRGGDTIDLRPHPATPTFNSRIATVVVESLSGRFGTEDTSAVRFVAENAIEILDALVVRAFARDHHGDKEFLASGRALVISVLAQKLA